MTITIESFAGQSYGDVSFKPLATAGGDDIAGVSVSFEELTTSILVQGSGNQFLPLTTLGSEGAYGGASVAFEPLTTDGNEGIPIPSTAIVSFSQLTTSGIMLTGGLMTGSVSFLPLVTLGSEGPCGHSSVSFLPLTTIAMEFPILDIWLASNLPAITGGGTVNPRILDGVNALIPAIVMGEGRTGGQLNRPLGAITFAGAATIPNVARLDKPIGAITGTGIARASGLAVVNKTLGAITSSAYFGSGLDTEAPILITSAGSVINGATLSLDKKIPAVVMSVGTVTSGETIVLDALIPAVRMLNGATLRKPIPAIIAVATAEQIVTAQFIAYAMNMQNSPELDTFQRPGNAVTRYTNFPFIEIVRFGNKNYGVSADGIFSLEGNLDDTVAIPWVFDSFLSQFQSPKLKTASSVYAGGRIQGGMTYNITVMESDINTYIFTTPRNTDGQTHRQPLGKGIRSRYIGAGMADTLGRDFDLESLILEVNDMKRFV